MSQKISFERIRLANGVLMPKLGLGTYKMSPDDVIKSVPVALRRGYRLIDTATYYKNEEAVGVVVANLIKEGFVTRAEVFIESKLATFDQGYESALKAVDLSLNKLGLDYIDLYIIHWPGASKLDPTDPNNSELRRGSWRALEELYKAGKCKAIGVSNYLAHHLDEMKEYAEILPMVNQFELHPCYYPEETIDWCKRHNCAVQAYASLGEGKLIAEPFLAEHPFIKSAAAALNCSVAQLLLRWAWQHDFAIIPKSVKEERIIANAQLDFTIDEATMEKLDSLHRNAPMKVCWDPKIVR